MFVALFYVLRLNFFWKTLQDLFVLIEFEGLLDLIRLFNKVAYFGFELLAYFIFFAHFMKVLEFFLFLLIVRLHLADD